MKRFIYTVFACLSVLVGAQAQKPVFGNEWINYQQTYYKIPIAQKGLYRVTVADLQKAGLPTATLDPRTVQLFHRGVEQAIWVEGETDGKFDPSDYLEFIGQGNDGVPDSALYRPASAQPHPYYSLYSDTTAYFLTARTDAQPGKRMARYTDLDAGSGTSALVPEPFVWAEELRVFADQWTGGSIYPMGANYGNGTLFCAQDVGEGWFGVSIKPLTTYSQSISFNKAVAIAIAAPTLDLIVVGRTPVSHSVNVQVGPAGRQRLLPPLTLSNYDSQTLTIPLAATEATGNVVCSLSPQLAGDEVSIAVLRATYPHQTDMAGYTYREFSLRPAAGGRALLRLTNVPATARLLDITTPGQTSVLSGTLVNGTFTSVVREAGVARKLLMVSVAQPIATMQRVVFRNINPARVNFALVAHPATRQPVAESPDAVASYAAYRASKAGGGYDTLTINTHQLYNQFNYGERSVLAIRRFADFIARGSAASKYLLLVGRSVEPHQNVRRNPFADTLDMIPNPGFPGSDVSIITGIAGRPAFVPGIAISRLYVTRPQQVLAYLTKLKEHEAAPNTAPWRKQMLNLSGGRSSYELSLFRAFVDEFGQNLINGFACAAVETVAKQTDNPTEDIPIANQVNRGVGIISMFGHSSLDVSDVNIGYVSNDRLGYRNRGRYPLLLASGCAAGNFYYYIRGFRTFITDWVLTPERGAIVTLAHTYNGFVGPLKNYSDQLYAVLSDSAWVGKTIGEIQLEAVGRYVARNQNTFDWANAEQITLQGDPAVRPFPFTKPDLTFSEGGAGVRTVNNQLVLKAVALNAGRATGKPVEVRVRAYEANGRILFTTRQRHDASRFSDTLTINVPNSNTLLATNPFFEFYADADGLLDEERRDNNVLRFDKTGKIADLPFAIDNVPPVVEVAFDGRRIENDEFVAPAPAVEVLIADENTKLSAVAPPSIELYLQRPCAQQPCPFDRLPVAAQNWRQRGADWVYTYRPATPLPNGVYTLEAYGSDLSGNRAQPYAIRFVVRSDQTVVAVTTAPNPFSYQSTIRFTLTGSTTPPSATLRIFDLAGREIRSMQRTPIIGTNEFVWDGTNENGASVAAGTYLYRLDLPGYEVYENDARQHLTGQLVLTR